MGREVWGFGWSKELLGQLPGLQPPSCRLNVHKTTLASTKLPSNWGSWELAVHRDVVGS